MFWPLMMSKKHCDNWSNLAELIGRDQFEKEAKGFRGNSCLRGNIVVCYVLLKTQFW